MGANRELPGNARKVNERTTYVDALQHDSFASNSVELKTLTLDGSVWRAAIQEESRVGVGWTSFSHCIGTVSTQLLHDMTTYGAINHSALIMGFYNFSLSDVLFFKGGHSCLYWLGNRTRTTTMAL